MSSNISANKKPPSHGMSPILIKPLHHNRQPIQSQNKSTDLVKTIDQQSDSSGRSYRYTPFVSPSRQHPSQQHSAKSLPNRPAQPVVAATFQSPPKRSTTQQKIPSNPVLSTEPPSSDKKQRKLQQQQLLFDPEANTQGDLLEFDLESDSPLLSPVSSLHSGENHPPYMGPFHQLDQSSRNHGLNGQDKVSGEQNIIYDDHISPPDPERTLSDIAREIDSLSIDLSAPTSLSTLEQMAIQGAHEMHGYNENHHSNGSQPTRVLSPRQDASTPMTRRSYPISMPHSQNGQENYQHHSPPSSSNTSGMVPLTSHRPSRNSTGLFTPEHQYRGYPQPRGVSSSSSSSVYGNPQSLGDHRGGSAGNRSSSSSAVISPLARSGAVKPNTTQNDNHRHIYQTPLRSSVDPSTGVKPAGHVQSQSHQRAHSRGGNMLHPHLHLSPSPPIPYPARGPRPEPKTAVSGLPKPTRTVLPPSGSGTTSSNGPPVSRPSQPHQSFPMHPSTSPLHPYQSSFIATATPPPPIALSSTTSELSGNSSLLLSPMTNGYYYNDDDDDDHAHISDLQEDSQQPEDDDQAGRFTRDDSDSDDDELILLSDDDDHDRIDVFSHDTHDDSSRLVGAYVHRDDIPAIPGIADNLPPPERPSFLPPLPEATVEPEDHTFEHSSTDHSDFDDDHTIPIHHRHSPPSLHTLHTTDDPPASVPITTPLRIPSRPGVVSPLSAQPVSLQQQQRTIGLSSPTPLPVSAPRRPLYQTITGPASTQNRSRQTGAASTRSRDGKLPAAPKTAQQPRLLTSQPGSGPRPQREAPRSQIGMVPRRAATIQPSNRKVNTDHQRPIQDGRISQPTAIPSGSSPSTIVSKPAHQTQIPPRQTTHHQQQQQQQPLGSSAAPTSPPPPPSPQTSNSTGATGADSTHTRVRPQTTKITRTTLRGGIGRKTRISLGVQGGSRSRSNDVYNRLLTASPKKAPRQPQRPTIHSQTHPSSMTVTSGVSTSDFENTDSHQSLLDTSASDSIPRTSTVASQRSPITSPHSITSHNNSPVKPSTSTKSSTSATAQRRPLAASGSGSASVPRAGRIVKSSSSRSRLSSSDPRTPNRSNRATAKLGLLPPPSPLVANSPTIPSLSRSQHIDLVSLWETSSFLVQQKLTCESEYYTFLLRTHASHRLFCVMREICSWFDTKRTQYMETLHEDGTIADGDIPDGNNHHKLRYFCSMGTLINLILPFNANTRVTDQAAMATELAKQEQAKQPEITALINQWLLDHGHEYAIDPSSLLTNAPESVRTAAQNDTGEMYVPTVFDTIDDLVHAASAVRKFIRVKMADENDVNQAIDSIRILLTLCNNIETAFTQYMQHMKTHTPDTALQGGNESDKTPQFEYIHQFVGHYLLPLTT